MRFARSGPDVPERLVQAHEDEEGEVVFFCGAGISYPAGLPGFRDLVRQIYSGLHELQNAVESTAYKEQRFDAVIELLERRLEDRMRVREQLRNVLTPTAAALATPASFATHSALLALSKTREGSRRLVTTNFDRLFFSADSIHRNCVAPYLPIPKRSRWDGVVYLHGLLPTTKDASALNSLVASSGDFGLAYLTERWASRFVSELFRDYVVCFVGYSVGDPVMRYMVDALSADSMMGERPREVFAFGSFKRGAEKKETQTWKAKGITPILYGYSSDHRHLHGTLHRWAEVYRDGLTGKRLLVAREATGKPSKVVGDGQVDRVVWALSDPSGAPAKEFAELNPAPPIDWLSVLDENGLLDKVCPGDCAPRLALVHSDNSRRGAAKLDPPTWWLARWFLRHLEAPEAIAWVIRKGACLHPTFRDLIEGRLIEAPPSHPIASVWEIIASGRACRSSLDHARLFEWKRLLTALGWNVVRRRELLRLLSPVVELRPAMDWSAIYKDAGGVPEGVKGRIKEVADWDISLAAGEHLQDFFSDIRKQAEWIKILQDTLPGLTDALLETLELMEALGDASDESDSSYSHRPSVIEHGQNQEFQAWTVLITLLRDAWLEVGKIDEQAAFREYQRWKALRFPLFKRMALFAAANGSFIHVSDAVSLLLSRNAWWLWSIETQREVFRLLNAIATRVDGEEGDKLWEAILLGPPRQMFRDDVEPAEWLRIRDHSIWLRLKKLDEFGAALPLAASGRLEQLSEAYPWRLSSGDQDEFPVWMGEVHEVIPGTRAATLPRVPAELKAALLARPPGESWHEDDWTEICRTEPSLAMGVLLDLAESGNWPRDVWRAALQAFSDEKLARQSWGHLSTALLESPQASFHELNGAIAWWLHSVAGSIDSSSPEVFIALLHRVLTQEYDEEKVDHEDIVFAAINHPVGHATQALLKNWYTRKPAVDEGLPEVLLPLFALIVDASVLIFRLGRVVLAANLASLYAADAKWTTSYLIPRFDWSKDKNEAEAVWKGYLWSPRITSSLLEQFKTAFLSTAERYGDLGKHGRVYAELLVIAALELKEAFKPTELIKSLNALPPEGLAQGLNVVVRSLGSAEQSRQAYWEHRARPLITDLWPKSANKRSHSESEAFARLCVAADTAFADAVDVVLPFLRPVRGTGLVVHQIKSTRFPEQYPAKVLNLLAAINSVEAYWPGPDMREVLQRCIAVDRLLTDTPEYRKLDEYLQSKGI
jgi:hypothetical protein